MRYIALKEISDEATVTLTAVELVSIFKSVLIEQANIDLDELGVFTLIKYQNNCLLITLDTEELRENKPYFYFLSTLVQKISVIRKKYK